MRVQKSTPSLAAIGATDTSSSGNSPTIQFTFEHRTSGGFTVMGVEQKEDTAPDDRGITDGYLARLIAEDGSLISQRSFAVDHTIREETFSSDGADSNSYDIDPVTVTVEMPTGVKMKTLEVKNQKTGQVELREDVQKYLAVYSDSPLPPQTTPPDFVVRAPLTSPTPFVLADDNPNGTVTFTVTPQSGGYFGSLEPDITPSATNNHGALINDIQPRSFPVDRLAGKTYVFAVSSNRVNGAGSLRFYLKSTAATIPTKTFELPIQVQTVAAPPQRDPIISNFTVDKSLVGYAPYTITFKADVSNYDYCTKDAQGMSPSSQIWNQVGPTVTTEPTAPLPVCTDDKGNAQVTITQTYRSPAKYAFHYILKNTKVQPVTNAYKTFAVSQNIDVTVLSSPKEPKIFDFRLTPGARGVAPFTVTLKAPIDNYDYCTDRTTAITARASSHSVADDGRFVDHGVSAPPPCVNNQGSAMITQVVTYTDPGTYTFRYTLDNEYENSTLFEVSKTATIEVVANAGKWTPHISELRSTNGISGRNPFVTMIQANLTQFAACSPDNSQYAPQANYSVVDSAGKTVWAEPAPTLPTCTDKNGNATVSIPYTFRNPGVYKFRYSLKNSGTEMAYDITKDLTFTIITPPPPTSAGWDLRLSNFTTAPGLVGVAPFAVTLDANVEGYARCSNEAALYSPKVMYFANKKDSQGESWSGAELPTCLDKNGNAKVHLVHTFAEPGEYSFFYGIAKDGVNFTTYKELTISVKLAAPSNISFGKVATKNDTVMTVTFDALPGKTYEIWRKTLGAADNTYTLLTDTFTATKKIFTDGGAPANRSWSYRIRAVPAGLWAVKDYIFEKPTLPPVTDKPLPINQTKPLQAPAWFRLAPSIVGTYSWTAEASWAPVDTASYYRVYTTGKSVNGATMGSPKIFLDKARGTSAVLIYPGKYDGTRPEYAVAACRTNNDCSDYTIEQ